MMMVCGCLNSCFLCLTAPGDATPFTHPFLTTLCKVLTVDSSEKLTTDMRHSVSTIVFLFTSFEPWYLDRKIRFGLVVQPPTSQEVDHGIKDTWSVSITEHGIESVLNSIHSTGLAKLIRTETSKAASLDIRSN